MRECKHGAYWLAWKAREALSETERSLPTAAGPLRPRLCRSTKSDVRSTVQIVLHTLRPSGKLWILRTASPPVVRYVGSVMRKYVLDNKRKCQEAAKHLLPKVVKTNVTNNQTQPIQVDVTQTCTPSSATETASGWQWQGHSTRGRRRLAPRSSPAFSINNPFVHAAVPIAGKSSCCSTARR